MEKSELIMLFAALVLFIYFDTKLQTLERRLLHIQLSGRYGVPAPMVRAPVQPQITERMAESIVPSRDEQEAQQAQQIFAAWQPYDGSGFAPVW